MYIFLAAYDPGWNDPPMLGYTPPNPSTKPKLNLNKRVAFPMQSSPTSGTSQVKLASSGLPLPQAGGSSLLPSVFTAGNNLPSIPLPPPPSIVPSEVGSCSLNKKEEINTDVRDFCLKVFGEVEAKFPKDDKFNKYENIHKSLEILRTMWLDDKIDLKISEILHEMAKSFESNDMEKAAECHHALIQDGRCFQWTLAFRHLIVFIGWDKPDESVPAPTEDPIPQTEEVKLITVANSMSDETKSDSKNNFSKIYHI